METTIMVYVGIMEKSMETTVMVYWRDIGKEYRNYF